MTATDWTDAASVLVIEQPDAPGKPWLEWVRNYEPGPCEGVLGIHAGRKLDLYRVDMADVPAGRGFRFTKLSSPDKHGYVCATTFGGGEALQCECWSWLARGRCRHTTAAMALLARKVV